LYGGLGYGGLGYGGLGYAGKQIQKFSSRKLNFSKLHRVKNMSIVFFNSSPAERMVFVKKLKQSIRLMFGSQATAMG